MFDEMDIDVMMGFSDEDLSVEIDCSEEELTEEFAEDTMEDTYIDQEVTPAPVEKKHRGITEVLVGLVRRA